MPVPVFTEKTDTVFAPWLVTKSSLWTASIAINSEPPPDGNGELETDDRLPEELTANADTVPEPELLTKAKLAGIPDDDIIPERPIVPHPLSRRRGASAAKIKVSNRAVK